MGRMLFIHIPKNGGHSVLNVMRAHGGFRASDEWDEKYRSHQSAWTIKQRLGSEWYDFDPVALVRNPWDRAVSLYFGVDKYKDHSPERFQKYMRSREGTVKHRWNPWQLQTQMVNDEVRVFRLDDIDSLYAWMAQVYKIDIGTPGIRKTGKNRHVDRLPFQDYYTEELRIRVGEVHEKEILKYEWAFE